MNKPMTVKRFLGVSSEARDEYVSEFDQEFIADTFHPLTPAQRREWERIRRKPGRPQNGAGAKMISVTVERRLLDASDRLAKQKKITRAALIARGLRAVLAAEGLAAPE